MAQVHHEVVEVRGVFFVDLCIANPYIRGTYSRNAPPLPPNG
jgi:hypothetical protein